MKPQIALTALIVLSVFLFSCSSDNVKENINKAGDVTGQAVGEFASGVSNGVEKAVQPNITLSENLKNKGISFGKMTLKNDSAGTDNLLTVYVIFNQDFIGTILSKAFDSNGMEMGRVKLDVSAKKDEARFLDFHFDKRTNIDNDSKITLE